MAAMAIKSSVCWRRPFSPHTFGQKLPFDVSRMVSGRKRTFHSPGVVMRLLGHSGNNSTIVVLLNDARSPSYPFSLRFGPWGTAAHFSCIGRCRARRPNTQCIGRAAGYCTQCTIVSPQGALPCGARESGKAGAQRAVSSGVSCHEQAAGLPHRELLPGRSLPSRRCGFVQVLITSSLSC